MNDNQRHTLLAFGVVGIAGGVGLAVVSILEARWMAEAYVPDDPNDALEGESAMSDASNPQLVTGYRQGKPFDLQVVSIGNGFMLEPESAQLFLAMNAAYKAETGKDLPVTTAFRSMEYQQRLYDRLGPGLASKPGWSNHQQGTAVDIAVQSSWDSPTAKWLIANASKFGFYGKVKKEPWHWSRTGY